MFFLYNLDNGERCTETSVSFTDKRLVNGNNMKIFYAVLWKFWQPQRMKGLLFYEKITWCIVSFNKTKWRREACQTRQRQFWPMPVYICVSISTETGDIFRTRRIPPK